MTVNDFKTETAGKIFVELQGSAISDFTSLVVPDGADKGPGQEMREWATEKGILVFLSSLHQIYAKGRYYGCDPEEFSSLQTRLTTLGSAVSDLTTNLQTLTGTVGTIDGRVDDLEDWTAEKATTIANNVTNISTLTSQVAALQSQVNALDPNASGDTNPIQDAIDARLAALLGFVMNDPEDQQNPNTWNNTTQGGNVIQVIKTLQTSVSTLSTTVAAKADQLDFNTLATKIGNISWSDDPQAENKTLVTLINENHNSIQTLETAISGIPHFNIAVVQQLPTNTVENPVSRSTIYLVPQQNVTPGEESGSGESSGSGEGSGSNNQQSNSNNREMFEEYIWVNKNAATQGAEENWGWERLGSQFFDIDTYVDQDALDAIASDLQGQITAITQQFNSSLISRVSANESAISSIQSTLSSLQTTTTNLATELHSLIVNGVFQLTGEDIKTSSAQDSNTIAVDISALQSNKLDKSALEWAIIGQGE